MSIEEQVRRVLAELSPEGAGSDAFSIESRGSIAALRPIGAPMAAFSRTLQSCADRMADAGFLVALVRDGDGAYVRVS